MITIFHAKWFCDKWKAILNLKVQSNEMVKIKTSLQGERWHALILLSLCISFQTKTNKPLIEAENVKMWLTCLYECLQITPFWLVTAILDGVQVQEKLHLCACVKPYVTVCDFYLLHPFESSPVI